VMAHHQRHLGDRQHPEPEHGLRLATWPDRP
jgi:hypothetical protein